MNSAGASPSLENSLSNTAWVITVRSCAFSLDGAIMLILRRITFPCPVGWACVLMTVWIVLSFADPVTVLAQETTSPQAENKEEHADSTDPAEKPDRTKRHRVITVAIYLLGGIVVGGLSLIGLVLLWGVRMRRIARPSLPEQTDVDELWYLKPKKKKPTSGLSDVHDVQPNEDESGSS